MFKDKNLRRKIWLKIKKSVRKNKEVKNSIKKIKGLEQKIKENPDNKKVDIDKEIDEIIKISNVDTGTIEKPLEKIINKELYNNEYEKIYENIIHNHYEGYIWNNKKYKIKEVNKEQDYYAGNYFNYYFSIENVKGDEEYVKFNIFLKDNLIEKLPLLWKIKNFWYKNNPINLYKKYKVKKDYGNDIKEMLYNGGCIKENPFKNKNEYKSSLTDKIKWFGHNLLHCQCSDREETSCDIDINEIIKNNSYEGIKEYEKEKDELYKLQGQVRSILEIMDNKEYPLNEYKINEDGTYRPYFSDKWVKRLTELGYDSHLKEDLERFIKDGEKNIRKSLYENDIKDRRQGRIGD